MITTIPSGTPLFKASYNYDKSNPGMTLDPSGFYFFGVKDISPEYISSYENEYGIIYEFITTRDYKLLALDDMETQRQIYRDAPERIQSILRTNYGYNEEGNPLKRTSTNDADRELSKYLCGKGYEGYAIKNMVTDFGGEFHPEFMFCNIDGIQYVKQITTDEERINSLLDRKKGKDMGKQLREARQSAIKESKENTTSNSISDTKKIKPMTLFSDDMFGGIKNNKNKNKNKSKSKKYNKNKSKNYNKSKSKKYNKSKSKKHNKSKSKKHNKSKKYNKSKSKRKN